MRYPIIQDRSLTTCQRCLFLSRNWKTSRPGTWYINVLAVRPQFRRLGLGTKLLGLADETAEALGKPGPSVIVSEANTGARRLYDRYGYSESATRLMVKENWQNEGHNWVLLRKDLSVPQKGISPYVRSRTFAHLDSGDCYDARAKPEPRVSRSDQLLGISSGFATD